MEEGAKVHRAQESHQVPLPGPQLRMPTYVTDSVIGMLLVVFFFLRGNHFFFINDYLLCK